MPSFHSFSFPSPPYLTTSDTKTRHLLHSHSISSISFTINDQLFIMTDDKIARFERLYQLDDFPEDHINETSDAELLLKRSSRGTRKPPVSKRSNAASSPIRRRPEPEVIDLTSFSSPPPEVRKMLINSTTAEKPSRKTKDVQLKRKRSRKIPTPEPKHIDPIVALMTGQEFSPLPVKGKGKKKDPPLKMAHESRQIFKGLHFCKITCPIKLHHDY
jgi:hypothetical protein